jgi:hypothetical protein
MSNCEADLADLFGGMTYRSGFLVKGAVQGEVFRKTSLKKYP